MKGKRRTNTLLFVHFPLLLLTVLILYHFSEPDSPSRVRGWSSFFSSLPTASTDSTSHVGHHSDSSLSLSSALSFVSPFMRSLRTEAVQFQAKERRRPPLRYQPELVRLNRPLIDAFELMHCDPETADFLAEASSLNVVSVAVADLLRFVVSRTTANGLVGRGFMFVMSTAQACQLLRPADVPLTDYLARLEPLVRTPEGQPPCTIDVKEANAPPLPAEAPGAAPIKSTGPSGLEVMAHLGADVPRFQRLLDIGAGDGGVTAKLAPLVEQVFATEVSMTMRWRLRRRGYTVLNQENPFQETDPATGAPRRLMYDLISLSNVLDRTDAPQTLLQDIYESLTPDGYFLLSVVLPWCPFVEAGKAQRRPTEPLPMEGGECCKGARFEDSVNRLVDNVLVPMGFELVRWTKLPYICQGNLDIEYALLHDAVFVLRRKQGATAREEL